MKKLTKLKSRGDTIVEVLIVLAVLGLAISISYETANRSLLNSSQAEENSEGTALVQSQIEELKTMTANAGINKIFRAGGFCIYSNAGVDTVQTLSGTDPTVISYPAGSPCVLGGPSNNRYHLAISYLKTATASTFKVEAAWDDVEGEGQDTVTLFYNLYPST